MDFLTGHALSLVLFLPAAGALLIVWLPDRLREWARKAALVVSLLDLGLALFLLGPLSFTGGFQAMEKAPWIPRYDIFYHLGVDGLGFSLVLLTLVLTPLAILAPYDGAERNRGSFWAAILFLETGLLGVFMSLDLVLFYLFWEAVLLPAYFILGLWGGERRIRAAVRFILYTLAGSLLMLVGIIVLYTKHQAAMGYGSFNLSDLAGLSLPPDLQAWLFAAFAFAFAVKAPLFPFHSWLPDAYVEAPTAGSVLMSGVMAKMGAYGFIRFGLTLFPDAARRFAPWIVALALAGVIWGAFLALAQRDLKRLVAWSSFSHMGFILLGIFVLNSTGLTGAALQMLSHGLVTGGLFILAAIVSRRAGTGAFASLEGFAGRRAVLAAAVTFFSLAALGLPGLSSFVGEFLIVSGAFRYRLAAGFLASTGVALGAWYFLRLAGRLAWTGPDHGRAGEGGDLGLREAFLLALPAVGIVWLGLFPGGVLGMLRPGLELLLKKLGVM